MSQTLVRQIISKSSGLPETGKTVLARPIWAVDATHDYPMPETPSGSGYYVSTTAIPHDTYRIFVEGVESGEEVTVQPGRAIIGSQGDESTSPPKSLDRIINNKVTLSMFVSDTGSAPTNDNFVAAINFAIANNKTLVIDYPSFAPTVDTSVTGILIIDLNACTLDFETNGTSLTATMLVVKTGTVKLKTGGKTLIGRAKLDVTDVYLSGDVASQVTATVTDSYTGCRGISSLGFSRQSGSYDYTVPRVSGGDSAFDVASLVLGDYNTSASGNATGDARRVSLQQTIDEELERLHYLIGKRTSTTPYSEGFLNDLTLSSIASLCSISESLVSISDFSSSDPVDTLSDEVSGYQLRNSPTGITLQTISGDYDGLYEIRAAVRLTFYHNTDSGSDGTTSVENAGVFIDNKEDMQDISVCPYMAVLPGSVGLSGIGAQLISISSTSFRNYLVNVPARVVRFSKSSSNIFYLRLGYTLILDSSYPDRARITYRSRVTIRKVGN